jgi:hypothetical protein
LEKRKTVFLSRYLFGILGRRKSPVYMRTSIVILNNEPYARYTEEISEIVKKLDI